MKMIRIIIALTFLLSIAFLLAADDKPHKRPRYDYDVARAHQIKPHRRIVPLEGIDPGFHQLHLTLTVSPTGQVVDAQASGDSDLQKVWPQVQDEVLRWEYTPFEHNGKAVTAEVEEYLGLVPPERLPTNHIPAPLLRRNSKTSITLQRSGCFGSCPSYTVAIEFDRIDFNGRSYVVAAGTHTDKINPAEVRKLAKRFIAADFYSMDPAYADSVTDNPTYVLSISIDGHTKTVRDYVGAWVGMPAIITELENAVDELAQTQRWVAGEDGLVQALQDEKFDFHTFQAQVMLKEAATRGRVATVRELLDAGVPLTPLPAPKPTGTGRAFRFADVGWLAAASRNPEALKVLIDAEAGNNDQKDKDLALVGAARSGKLEAARALIAYGANPNADLSELTVMENSGGMTMGGPGAGSVLIYAAESGNPEMVREILRYHPKLEQRDAKGRTAVFAAAEYRYGDEDGTRVECLRLLAQGGADVNARDEDGNTPLHDTFLTDVEEELLKLGADVNARNTDGETPIFTTVDDEAIPLFIDHGADLTIRNNDGKTVMEEAERRGPARQEALRKAMQRMNERRSVVTNQ